MGQECRHGLTPRLNRERCFLKLTPGIVGMIQISVAAELMPYFLTGCWPEGLPPFLLYGPLYRASHSAALQLVPDSERAIKLEGVLARWKSLSFVMKLQKS